MNKFAEKLMEKQRITDVEKIAGLFVPINPASDKPFYNFNEQKAHKCHIAVQKALKSGALKKKDDCEICKSKSQVAHHFDYEKPTDVVWLCHKCHYQVHKNIQFLLWLAGFKSKYKPKNNINPKKTRPPKKTELSESDIFWTPPNMTRQEVARDLNALSEIRRQLKSIMKLAKQPK